MQAVLLMFIALTCAHAESIDGLLDYLHSLSTNSKGVERNTRGAAHNNKKPCACVPYFMCIEVDVSVRINSTCDPISVCCSKQGTFGPPFPPPPTSSPPQKASLPPVRTSSALPSSSSLPPQPFSTSSMTCGARNLEGVGSDRTAENGHQAQFGEFPWMAVVFSEMVENSSKRLLYECGGALIHPQVVMTAAHCVNKEGQFKVRLGEWNIQADNELLPHQDRSIQTVTIHPEFKAETFANDIALLVLTQPVDIAGNVDMVCLPQQGLIVNDFKCLASGWGKDRKDGEYQAILKKLDLPIVSSDSCEERLRKTQLGKDFKLHDSFICAGGVSDRNTCTGDGGSPLVCPMPGAPGRYFQAGIVSWGVGCGGERIPVVYTNIAKYCDWIDKHLSQFVEVSGSQKNVEASPSHQNDNVLPFQQHFEVSPPLQYDRIDKYIPEENANATYYHHEYDKGFNKDLPKHNGNISFNQHHHFDRIDKHNPEQNANFTGYQFQNAYNYSWHYEI